MTDDYQAFMDSQLPVKLCPKCGSEMRLLEMHSVPGIWFLWECDCGHEEKVKE